MDEFENMALISDDFGIEPVHIAASVGAAGVLWYGHHKKWWHHLWPFGRKPVMRDLGAPPRAMTSPAGAAIEDMPAPQGGPPVYHDELMQVESMGGFYTPDPPAPVVNESSYTVDETVETTEETMYVETLAHQRRPAPPIGQFISRPAPPTGQRLMPSRGGIAAPTGRTAAPAGRVAPPQSR